MQHWEIISGGWKVEKPQEGCESFPLDIDPEVLEYKSCFATSNKPCKKEQIIDLQAEGLGSPFLDTVQPSFTVSEW